MGMSWSSVSECLGDFSHSHHHRHNRLPPSRRLTATSSSRALERPPALRQRYISDDKLTLSSTPSSPTSCNQQHSSSTKTPLSSSAPTSNGAAIAPPPPPLVPDPHSVYDLLEDESEDVCPTCLESYTPDNPKINTTCAHAFHLQCIVAWETRSGTRFCPICATLMDYVEAGQTSK